jgi:hypothetical protein
MPAISPFLVHASGDGVRMSDVGLKGDEDFLLVHSVEDTAEYGNEITRFGITGEKVYHCLQDPKLTFSFDADCLAFEGLANCHPGRTVTAASINNLIPNAFGWDGPNRIYVYRRPRRRRSAAALATIQFEIEVMNAVFQHSYDNPNGLGTTGDPLSSLTYPDPDTVLTSSTEGFQPVTSLFGATIFWRRRGTINLTSYYDPGNLMGMETREYCQSWALLGNTKPPNLTAFYANVDNESNETESTIVEVFDVTTGTHMLEDTAQGNQLPTLLGNAQNPIDTQVFPNPACRWLAVWLPAGGPEHIKGEYFGSEADLAAFLAVYNGGAVISAEKTLVALYDMKKSMWAYGP